jgi:hypothetical protein
MGISPHVQTDQGAVNAAISREVVQLHQQLTGRGPKLVRTYSSFIGASSSRWLTATRVAL